MTAPEPDERIKDGQPVVATPEERRRHESMKGTRQQLAALYRCQDCGVWWGSSPQHMPGEHWVFQLIEGREAQYAWADYRSWRTGCAATVCPECGKEASLPAFSLPIMRA